MTHDSLPARPMLVRRRRVTLPATVVHGDPSRLTASHGPEGAFLRGPAGRYRALLVGHVRRHGGSGWPILPIAAISVLSIVGTALSPALLHTPAVLIALAPRTLFLAFAAPRLDPWTFVTLATARLCVGDPFHFLLGRRFGDGACASAGRLARRLGVMRRIVAQGRRRLEAVPARWTDRLLLLLIVVRPTGRHVAIAGARRVPAGAVVVADLAGTLGYTVLLYLGARAVGSAR